MKEETQRQYYMITERLQNIQGWAIALRFFSNLLLFYTIVALSTFNWFPFFHHNTDKECFVKWHDESRKWISLAVIGGLGMVLLVIRMVTIDIVDGMNSFF